MSVRHEQPSRIPRTDEEIATFLKAKQRRLATEQTAHLRAAEALGWYMHELRATGRDDQETGADVVHRMREEHLRQARHSGAMVDTTRGNSEGFRESKDGE